MKIISIIVSIILIITGILLSISGGFEYDRENNLYYTNPEKSVETYEKAKLFINDERLNKYTGLELYWLAQEKGIFSKEGQNILTLSEEILKESLLKSPTDSESWLTLARMQLMLGKEYSEISKSVYMSAITAPHDFNILNDRLKMAIIVWNYLETDEKDYFEKQIKIYWDAKPVDIVLLFEKRKEIVGNLIDLKEEEKSLKNNISSKEVKVQSEDYLKLASIEYIKNGESYQGGRYLNESMKSAPYLTKIHLDRLKLVMKNWDYLNIAGMKLARKQIRIGLKMYPEVMYETFVRREEVEIINSEIPL